MDAKGKKNNALQYDQDALILLHNLENLGMVDIVGTVEKELRKRDFKAKEKKVLDVHTYKITKTCIKNHGKETTVYQTRCNGKRPRRYCYEDLIEYLYYFYFPDKSTDIDYSFGSIWNMAIDEWIRTENPKEKTIRDAYASYKAFIRPELASKDIRTITPSEIKEYIQKVTQELQPTKKRLYKFKGVLNRAFNFAVDPEHHIIEHNPVPDSNKAYVKNCILASNRPEDKAFQPDEIKMIQEHLWERIERMQYDVNGYAILFSSETGVREGEIPSLRWEDVTDTYIHIHSQQNDEIRDGKKYYYYNPSTKNEKGVSRGGRKIPMNDRIRNILVSLRKKQEELGIHSEWVFARSDGSWINVDSYSKSLYRLCKGDKDRGTTGLGLRLSNNHAFRMALNSYVFVPMGLTPAERAKILGHSVQTNLNHYTFARSDDYITDISNRWNTFNNGDPLPYNEGSYLKIVPFETKEKALRTANS